MLEYNGTYTINQMWGSICVSFSNKQTPVDSPIHALSRLTQHLLAQPTSLRHFQAPIPVTARNKGPQPLGDQPHGDEPFGDEPLNAWPRPPRKARDVNFPRRPTARAFGIKPWHKLNHDRDATSCGSRSDPNSPPRGRPPCDHRHEAPTGAAPAARGKLAAANYRAPAWLPPTDRRELSSARPGSARWAAPGTHSAVSSAATGARSGARRVRCGPSPPGRAAVPPGHSHEPRSHRRRPHGQEGPAPGAAPASACRLQAGARERLAPPARAGLRRQTRRFRALAEHAHTRGEGC